MSPTHLTHSIVRCHRFAGSARALTLAVLLVVPIGCGDGASENAPAGDTGGVSGGDSVAETVAAAAPQAESEASEAAVADAAPDRSSAGPVQGTPPIRLDPPMLDFGFVPPSSASTGTIALVNTGRTPLKILAVQPSCKCTTISDLAGKEIPAGGSVELEATLDAQPAPGPKRAQIRVLVEGYTQVVTVQLQAEVALSVRVTPPYINAVEGKNQTGRLVVQSTDGTPFRICSTHGMPPRYLGYDPATEEPRSQYLVEYDIADFGSRIPRYFVIETDREDAPLIDVLLRHEDSFPAINIRMKDYRIPAGVIASGDSTEFTIRLDNRIDRPAPSINAAISRSPDGTVEFVGQEIDEANEEVLVTLRLTPKSDYEGFLYLPFTIFAQTGQTQDLDVFAKVSPGGVADCGGATSTEG